MGIIYKSTNRVNGKSYIGQSIKTLKKRKADHIAESNRNSQYYFHRALRKYGENNFDWKIIDTCNSLDELNEMEPYYIEKYHTFIDDEKCNGYNLTTGGKNYIPSESTKDKNRQSHLGKSLTTSHRENIRKSMIGRIVSEETRQKISKIHTGKFVSKETGNKISKTRIERGVAVGKNNPMYGKKRPDLAQFNKNRVNRDDYINPMQGKDWRDYATEETIQQHGKNISKALRGKTRTDEAKRNYSKSAKNRIWFVYKSGKLHHTLDKNDPRLNDSDYQLGRKFVI